MAAVKGSGEEGLDRDLYRRLWEDIDRELGDCLRIYFSPDGIFHEINVEALEDASGSR